MTSNSTNSGNAGFADSRSILSAIREVSVSAPFSWLNEGLSDFRAAPTASLFYGGIFALMGWAMVFFYRHAYSLTVGLMCGFMLLGPALAMGLYALSRQREVGQVPSLRQSLTIWRVNLSNLSMFALVTGIVFLLWARASMVIFAVFYSNGLPTAENFVRGLLSLDNHEFLIVYLFVGSVFAAFVFSISVVAVPLMLDRRKDAITAMLLSLAVVGRNPLPMIVWAGLIVALIVVGFGTAFLGLVITAPILGHATWHAYRAMVRPD